MWYAINWLLPFFPILQLLEEIPLVNDPNHKPAGKAILETVVQPRQVDTSHSYHRKEAAKADPKIPDGEVSLGETIMPMRHNELHSWEILFYFISFVAIMIPHRKDGDRESEIIEGIATQVQ